MPQGKFPVIVGVILDKIQHHFRDGDDGTEVLIVDNGNQTAGLRFFNAAQFPGKDFPGAVGVLDLVPDEIRFGLRRFQLSIGVQGKDRCCMVQFVWHKLPPFINQDIMESLSSGTISSGNSGNSSGRSLSSSGCPEG